MSSYSSAEDEYDSDEPPELELDLGKFEETTDPSHASLARAGFTCIARFARVRGDDRGKEESEIATIRYLSEHSNLPVPEIYYQDLDPNKDVGAAYVLMENLPGRHLHKIWSDLIVEHKKIALSEIASIIAQFASLKFDKIGSVDANGDVGPVFNPCLESPSGPFDSTAEYLHFFVSPDSVESQELAGLYSRIRDEMTAFLERPGDAPYLQPPFVMIHADFDGQNMLFSQSADSGAPILTGLIDFEFAYTGPLYFLHEYPIFIQDVSWSKELYAENAILRSHFVREIFSKLRGPEEKTALVAAMNAKCFALNHIRDNFMSMKCSEKTLVNLASYYLGTLKEGTGLAYSGRLDYTLEKYSETGEPLLSASGEGLTKGQQPRPC